MRITFLRGKARRERTSPLRLHTSSFHFLPGPGPAAFGKCPPGAALPRRRPTTPAGPRQRDSPWAASAPRFPEETRRSRRQPPGNLQQRCPGGAAAAGRGEAAPAVCWRCEHCSVRLAESLCQAGSVLVLHERKKRWCWRRGE